MFQPGLVSITFRRRTPAQIVRLAARAGLRAIEWGGDVHVPHGDHETARTVRALTERAQLEVVAYGSYYRVGHSQSEGLAFTDVLRTAVELGAPVVRVWAGNRNGEDADAQYRRTIIEESRRLCELAAREGVLVAYEFHRGTLTNSAASARELLEAVRHPQLRTLWQPPVGASTAEAAQGLRLLLPWLSHLHVFQWNETQRRPLAEGRAAWREYLAIAGSSGRPCPALLEFVRDDDVAALFEDAATLRSWTVN